ncbi:YqjF family protein [Oceanobacillus neutriphilus]|uniref:DUF2071 domain-containing protein n=1 Tax=Oceanobacillus neutriphilus TaxID=531815 RepID=A0ABQ2P2U7_9BACI|nr:DUF2071 domain-containing protein [Oceanobacillus neutriphilus]GGP16761.1 hypothetical protein GCM10011346_50050 [Oceanobacillus neutriphilus]
MMSEKITQKTNNSFPWVLLQKWEHILFLHYPIAPETIKTYLPKEVELDTYNGQAWISIVAFAVSRNRLHYLPAVPYIHPMLQINVRTYIKRKGEIGVYFFTMDTNKLSAALGGRIVNAPFLHADMTMKNSANTYYIHSARKEKLPAAFQASYSPVGHAFYPEKQSLDYWLLERYIFWSYKKGRLYRGDIKHDRWEIRTAEVSIENQSLFLPGNALGENQIAHYASSKVALNGIIKKVK